MLWSRMLLYTLLKCEIKVWVEFKMVLLNLIECYFSIFFCFIYQSCFFKLYIILFWFSAWGCFSSYLLTFEIWTYFVVVTFISIKFSLLDSPSTGDTMDSVHCCNYLFFICFSVFLFHIYRWLAFEI